jgi:hypothetical protein
VTWISTTVRLWPSVSKDRWISLPMTMMRWPFFKLFAAFSATLRHAVQRDRAPAARCVTEGSAGEVRFVRESHVAPPGSTAFAISGASAKRGGQGGAPYWTNDLDAEAAGARRGMRKSSGRGQPNAANDGLGEYVRPFSYP